MLRLGDSQCVLPGSSDPWLALPGVETPDWWNDDSERGPHCSELTTPVITYHTTTPV